MLSIELENMPALQKWLSAIVPAELTRAENQALDEMAFLTQGEAKRRCPMSPTKSQYVQWLQRRRRTPGQSRSRRHDFNPGNLTNAIRIEKGADYRDVLVPKNSRAGKYAGRIHNGQYKSWKNLGPGSVAKQEKAGVTVGGKFITRAWDENQRAMHDVGIKYMERAAKKLR